MKNNYLTPAFLLTLMLFVLFTRQVNAQTIAGGWKHSLFACSNDSARACGYNDYGQLGDGTTTNRTTPVQVSGLTGIMAVAAGSWHSLFLKNDGTVWACGYNFYGQLGDGTVTDRNTPVQVSGLTGITVVVAGNYHSFFLKNDGTVWACGNNDYGQLGDGTTTYKTTPVQVSGLTGITAVAAGGNHSLFLKNDGSVWACGRNNYGQLGDGTTTNKTTPVQVSGITDITDITAGGSHSLFLKNDSTVWACGRNYSGQLGDGTTTDRTTPVQVSGLMYVTAVVARSNHSLFLKNDGTAWTCGWNNYGQLGDGTTTNRTSPVQVSGLSDITAIAGGWSHSVFLKNDGTVWACGYNDYGQLGDGTTTNRNTPVQTTNLCQIAQPGANCNPLPTAVAESSGPVCTDATSLTLNETGGDAISWSWSSDGAATITNTTDQSPTITGFADGEAFTVTVTDANGCQNTDSIQITVNPLPTVSANATLTTLCEGDSTTLSGSGAQNYTWDNGVSDGVSFAPASSNIYTVTGTDANGCSDTASIALTVNTVDVSVTQFSDTLSAINSNASYEWFNCNNATPPAGNINDQTFVATENGDYGVIISENGCVDTSACYAITTIGIIENDFSSSLAVYPNPASEKLNIDLGEDYPKVMVSVQDMQGKLLIQKNFDGQQLLELSLNDLANGVYTVNITAGEKRAGVKVVKGR